MEEKKEEIKKELNIEELKKKLEECQKLKEEYLAGWQRARADLLNYKKEEIERIEEILKYGGEEFILKILPILDNFDLAEKKLPEDLKNNDSIKGLLQIKTQILDFLRIQGVEEIKTIGEKFDPNFHEAVEQVEESKLSSSPSAFAREIEAKDKDSGIIVEEVQKGYKINGRLLKPAKVKVVK
ncbi:MAG: nucleotide exchange factor GrpE [Candidatus Nealsonbacteria bacterium]|nr:nucleotide exchange factor GrpE [Candidatus Nealsonbacteria bacterium]